MLCTRTVSGDSRFQVSLGNLERLTGLQGGTVLHSQYGQNKYVWLFSMDQCWLQGTGLDRSCPTRTQKPRGRALIGTCIRKAQDWLKADTGGETRGLLRVHKGKPKVTVSAGLWGHEKVPFSWFPCPSFLAGSLSVLMRRTRGHIETAESSLRSSK